MTAPRNPPRGAVHRLRVAVDASAGAVLAAQLLIVLWGVFTRFVIGEAAWWTEEAARLLLVWLTMLGAAAASARGEHLGVDFFLGRLHQDARRLAASMIEVVVMAFAASVLVYGGVVLVVETLRAGQTTPALGVPMGWVYLAAPLGGVAMMVFSASRLLRGGDGDEGGQPVRDA